MKGKIGFVWQGVSDVFDGWEDGLRAAMKLIEREYYVEYIEPFDDLDGYDLLIYWEAPCTINGHNAPYYEMVRKHPTPKILLFAGGPINAKWVEGFDEICIESKINKDEFAQVGVETHTAFGVNTDLFRPKKFKKKYKAIHHGTCASWKRQWLLQSFASESVLVGRTQPTDSYPFTYSRELGAQIFDETKGKDLVKLVNQSDVLVQSSDFWGGGQRATLEAMACGVPVICMSDSPKNIEYIEESGGGLIADPNPDSIRRAYDDIMKEYDIFSRNGLQYVQSKWTHVHYAQELKNVIKKLI